MTDSLCMDTQTGQVWGGVMVSQMLTLLSNKGEQALEMIKPNWKNCKQVSYDCSPFLLGRPSLSLWEGWWKHHNSLFLFFKCCLVEDWAQSLQKCRFITNYYWCTKYNMVALDKQNSKTKTDLLQAGHLAAVTHFFPAQLQSKQFILLQTKENPRLCSLSFSTLRQCKAIKTAAWIHILKTMCSPPFTFNIKLCFILFPQTQSDSHTSFNIHTLTSVSKRMAALESSKDIFKVKNASQYLMLLHQECRCFRSDMLEIYTYCCHYSFPYNCFSSCSTG